MSKYRFLAIVCVCALVLGIWGLFSFGVNTSLASQNPEQAARQGLPQILQTVSRFGPEKYGFTNAAEMELVTLGTPYQTYLLSPQAIQNYQPGQRIARMISPEQQWEFPVLVNGQARGLLTVAQQDGQWQVVGFGALGTSQKLVKLQAQASLNDASRPVKLLRVYPIRGLFALIERGGRESLVHLNSYPGLIDTPSLKLCASEELMPQLLRAVDQMRNGGRITQVP